MPAALKQKRGTDGEGHLDLALGAYCRRVHVRGAMHARTKGGAAPLLSKRSSQNASGL